MKTAKNSFRAANSDLPTDPEGPSEDEKEEIHKLRAAVLRADDAYRCCKGRGAQAEKIILDVKDTVEKIIKLNATDDHCQAGVGGLRAANACPAIPTAPGPGGLGVSIITVIGAIATTLGVTCQRDQLSPGARRFWFGDLSPEQQSVMDKMPEGWSSVNAGMAPGIMLALDLAADAVRKSTKDQCLACVKRKTLAQKKKRARGVWHSTQKPNAWPPPVRPNRMRIRIAHR